MLIETFRAPISLELPIDHDAGTTVGDALSDPVARHPADSIDRARRAARVGEMLHPLGPRERQILRWRFGLSDEREHTLREIANRIDRPRERVRPIEGSALAELRQVVDRWSRRARAAR